MKIVMLGPMSCGKTTYLAGMSLAAGHIDLRGVLVSSRSRHFGQGASQHAALEEEFVNPDTGEMRFPLGTRNTKVYEFELKYNGRARLDFDFIDFRGGIIDEIGDTSLPETAAERQNLYGHIQTAKGILLFIDGIDVALTTNPTEMAIRTRSARLISLIDDCAALNPDLNLPIVVVLTKTDSDLISEELRADDCRALVQKVRPILEPLRLLANRHNWRVSICPVDAVGLANVQSEVTSLRPGVPIGVTTTLKGFPEPVHIEVPLFTLLCQLAHLARDGRINRAQRLENQLNYLKARDKVDKFWDFILRRRPDQTVAEVLREWEDEDRVITELADTAAVLCDMAAKAQSL